MLVLRQGLSIPNIKSVADWTPINEGANLIAWYKFDTLIGRQGSELNSWGDSSVNSHDMVQAATAAQPVYNAGEIQFNSDDDSNLQTTTQISLSDEFTIAFKINASNPDVTILGDNTTTGEYIKIETEEILQVVADGNVVNINSSVHFIGEIYVVLTRSSGTVNMTVNGVSMSPKSLSGTLDIDAIGIRATDTNSFNGSMYDIQIYKITNAQLTANVTNYYANL